MDQVKSFAQNVIANIERVIVGKRDAIELAVIALLCQGHLLIEDVPGVGKTTLARSLARSLGCSFNRIQFTPDMLPSDITGVSIYNQATSAFEFRPGPVMAQVVLADEIKRATPKTQSALLEAMQESQLTVDGITHHLPRPFIVLATQNPIEYEGTFRLPEAQMDRFLMRIKLGYPRLDDEIDVLDRQQYRHPVEDLEAVSSAEEVIAAQDAIRDVFISPEIKRYIVEITQGTRAHAEVYLGASPRAAWRSTGPARSGRRCGGRDYVLPDDVKALVASVLGHRIIMGSGARLRDLTPDKIIEAVLANLAVLGGPTNQ